MMESDGFSRKSRVIVTSRDSGFLLGEGFDCYTVKPLKPEDATKLFCLDAFNTMDIPNDYEERVESFVQKGGGLPLTLTVVAKYVHAVWDDEKVWDDVLHSLRLAQPLNGSQEDELWSVLRGETKVRVLKLKSCYGQVAISIERLHGLKELRILLDDSGVTLHGQWNLLPRKLAYMRCPWLSQFAASHYRSTEPVAENRGHCLGLRHLVIGHYLSDGALDTLGDLPALQFLEINWQLRVALPENLRQL
ncbi:unnamed protein product [Calypogeia fissa]